MIDYKDAIADYNTAIEKGRKSYDVYYGRALCNFYLKKYLTFFITSEVQYIFIDTVQYTEITGSNP